MEETNPTSVQIAEALAQEARSGNRIDSVLAFGYPGTGKSAFCERLSWQLSGKDDYTDFLTVQCPEIGQSRDPSRVASIEKIISDQRYPRLTVYFDELEQISLDRERHPESALVTGSTMVLLRNLRSLRRCCLMVGITNCPALIDDGVLQFFGQTLFFGIPGRETLKAMLASNEFPDPEKTIDALLAKCQADKPVQRTLADAIRKLKTDVDQWKALSPEDLAEYLWLFNAAVDADRIARYEAEYRLRIRHAEGLRKMIARKLIRP